MEYNFLNNIETCYTEVPKLLYYSHIPPAIIVLFVGFFLLFWSKSNPLAAKLLFWISIVFSTWVIVEGSIWLMYSSINMMALWAPLSILYSVLHILSLYFVYVVVNKHDISIKFKIYYTLLLLPILIFASTKYNLSSFDYVNCQATEYLNFVYYRYFLGALSIVTILGYLTNKYFKALTKDIRRQILLLGFGVISFLALFSWSEITASFSENFEITQYGLFGMPIFMIFLSYLVVKFKAFDIKLLGAQALVWALIILIGSQFFFIQSNTNKILTAITLIISAVVGLMIIRSVKKEVAQREQIEQLAKSLESSNDKLANANFSLKDYNAKLADANERLKELDLMKSEFVSLATHQIRGPLAAIKGYISLMQEGDYGKVPKTFDEPLSTVFKSTDSLSRMVTDFLDVSRIDLGQMKYELTEFDFRDLVNEVATELKPNIDAKGLELRTKITEQACPIKADRTKLKQVLNNLVDNSSKYTKTGWLEISVEKKKDNNILFAVKDSGVGISQKTLSQLFQRFSRAKNANDSNILGTGLGLYIAKKMVEANNGKVWAESEGEGKGAQFYVEIPAVR